jgi:hypothetical protein
MPTTTMTVVFVPVPVMPMPAAAAVFYRVFPMVPVLACFVNQIHQLTKIITLKRTFF